MTPNNLLEYFPNFVLFKTAAGKVNIKAKSDKKLVRANYAHTTIKMATEQR